MFIYKQGLHENNETALSNLQNPFTPRLVLRSWGGGVGDSVCKIFIAKSPTAPWGFGEKGTKIHNLFEKLSGAWKKTEQNQPKRFVRTILQIPKDKNQ
jgi:hypothetical protein